MSQTTSNIQEEWLKVLGKGMVTLPKKWREEMNLLEGDIVKAKKMGNKVTIEPPNSQNAPYRIYSSSEINQFLQEDRIPQSLTKKIRQDLSFEP